MRAVVQRVANARVEVDGEIIGQIGKGILALVGFMDEDDTHSFSYMSDKLVNLRIFEDEQGKMNLSVTDIEGEILVVPNFTLYGDCRKGRRPGFSASSKPDKARVQFEEFCSLMRREGYEIKTGRFQANMQVHLVNDGPVTLIIDSDKII
jgi:D-tyrosyl-tRNA(Tyr) deacylase